MTSTSNAGIFLLEKRKDDTHPRIVRLSNYVFELAEAKRLVRNSNAGTTRFEGDGKYPWCVVIRPTGAEQTAVFSYLVEHFHARSGGRRVKAYVVFVQSEEAQVYYCGGIYSTLRAAKDYGQSDIIAVAEHRGGNRNVRFDPPDSSRDMWLES